MNRLLLLIALVAALSLPAAGIAQTADQTAIHAPTVKIGWMNVQQAIEDSDEGTRTLNDLQKFVDLKNNELDAMRREAEDLRTKLEVQSSKLTNEALMDLEERARVAELTLQRFSEDTQRDITNRRQRLYNIISLKMGAIIEKVAIDKGLDAVVIYDPQRDAWVNPALNVTEDIIKAYNQAYPAGLPTIPPAAKKP
ncbi:MAG: OmpH family outer membrane protein [Acidobacteria bacterium]|nr:OmpH family outer membrane protein [Acidobacteriota bacterium]